MVATINRLLGFERDCAYPAVREIESRITPKGEAFSSTWYAETECYLHDNYMVYSYLSRIAGNFYMATLRTEYLDLTREF